MVLFAGWKTKEEGTDLVLAAHPESRGVFEDELFEFVQLSGGPADCGHLDGFATVLWWAGGINEGSAVS